VGFSLRITGTVDQSGLRSFLEGDVAKAVQNAAGKVRDQAKAEITSAGLVDTGTMRNATVAEAVTVEGNKVVGRVVTNTDYAIYQHEGTRTPIVPRRARVLRFTAKGGGVVFRPKVRGVKATPFLTRALSRISANDFTA
jgi:RNase P/RNase MRP subunit p29